MLRRFLLLFIVIALTIACGPSDPSTSTSSTRPSASPSVQPTFTRVPILVLRPTATAALPEERANSRTTMGSALVTTALLNVRATAETTAPIIATLAAGDCLPIAGAIEAGWYQLVLTDGRTGWSSTDYLTRHATCPAAQANTALSTLLSVSEGSKGVVTTAILNVRAGPGETFAVTHQVVEQECLTVLKVQDGWVQITNDAGINGWSSRQFVDVQSSCPALPQPVAALPTAVPPAPAITTIAYQEQPFAPNATVVADAYLFECFGTGANELRFVTAGTPVQVLGSGSFHAPYAELGSGPFLKIRIWDGQYAWITASAVNVDLALQPALAGQCEIYDRIDWSTVIPPTPTQIIPTPTAYPSWVTNSPQPSTTSCCKICRKGKACGNSCISVNYTCHKGPGCACNG